MRWSRLLTGKWYFADDAKRVKDGGMDGEPWAGDCHGGGGHEVP